MSENESTTVDIVKENTARILEKIDSQVPLYVKMHSDLYRAHNRLLENTFKAAYSLERAELDLFIHARVPEVTEPWIRLHANAVVAQIELAGEFLKWYPQMYVLALKFLDRALQNYVRAICASTGDSEASGSDDGPDARKVGSQ